VEYINEIWNKIKQNKLSSWKNNRKKERPQINSWFDEECQIMLENKRDD
jgi:hypothetical protein